VEGCGESHRGWKPSSSRAAYAALKRRSSTVLLAAVVWGESKVKVKGKSKVKGVGQSLP